MKRSLFTTLDVCDEAGGELADHHSAALDQAVLAEELGFECFWLGEHHLYPIGSVPNPAVLLAAVAARTQRIRVGPAVAVVGMRDPLLLAEDYAMVDLVSRGRLNMGVGTGSRADEFEGMGRDFELRREAFATGLEVMLQRWETARRRDTLALNVYPVQRQPPIYVAAMSTDGARRAGRAGHSLLTLASPGTPSLDEVRARLAAHGEGLAESARGGDAVVTFLAHVGRTQEEALRSAAIALERFLGHAREGCPAPPRRLCEEMRDRGVGLFGTPEQVRDQLTRISEIGCGHAAFLANFGGLPPERVEFTVRALAAG